jgi:hypothetical protein
MEPAPKILYSRAEAAEALAISESTLDARPPVVDKGPKEQETPSDEEPVEPEPTVEATKGGRKLVAIGRS